MQSTHGLADWPSAPEKRSWCQFQRRDLRLREGPWRPQVAELAWPALLNPGSTVLCCCPVLLPPGAPCPCCPVKMAWTFCFHPALAYLLPSMAVQSVTQEEVEMPVWAGTPARLGVGSVWLRVALPSVQGSEASAPGPSLWGQSCSMLAGCTVGAVLPSSERDKHGAWSELAKAWWWGKGGGVGTEEGQEVGREEGEGRRPGLPWGDQRARRKRGQVLLQVRGPGNHGCGFLAGVWTWAWALEWRRAALWG